MILSLLIFEVEPSSAKLDWQECQPDDLERQNMISPNSPATGVRHRA